MNEKETTLVKNSTKQKKVYANPFPGLRAFTFEESHLFFGREGHCDEILLKLHKNHFVSIIGSSGSGKSSLMYCGLLPILYGGFMTKAGSRWKVFTSRPGLSPIDNLAKSLYLNGRESKSVDEQELIEGTAAINSLLRSNPHGLIDVIKQRVKSENQNILILIDQFEELFRLIRDKTGDVSEVLAFINLLTEAVTDKQVPVYVVITMRSDFIGESAKFPQLTKLINDSHYLIPQLNRNEQKMAIEGPIAVGGGIIAKRLVQQLLNDLSNNANQLPVMQHALMRTWNYWVANHDIDEPVDLRHYNAIGTIDEALSLHADETFNELNSKEKEVCETIFKSLTEKGKDNNGVRRPAKLISIAQIARVSELEVSAIIEKFRQPSRSLLLPSIQKPLESDTIIEISHESLMRIWDRLKIWVDEEAESAQMYLRLSEAAERYEAGSTGVWRPPDLQLALNWRKEQNPNYAWAQRYNPRYENAINFLEFSESQYKEEQDKEAKRQKRRIARIKMVSLLLGLAAVVSLLFFIFAIMKKGEADDNAAEALAYAQEAEDSKMETEQAYSELQISLSKEKELRILTQQQQDSIVQAILKADSSAMAAMNQYERAEYERIKAQKATAEAEMSADIAAKKSKEAEASEKKARQSAADANRQRLLSIAQNMTLKSLQVLDRDLQGGLALQAYTFNQQYGGNTYDKHIYDGLYYALKSLKNKSEIYKVKKHNGAIRSIAIDGNNIYSTGSDGVINKFNIDNPEESIVIHNNNFINRNIQLSEDSRWLINAGEMNYIQLFDMQNPNRVPVNIKGHNDFIFDLAFLPNNQYFISTSADSTFRLNDFTSSRLLKKNNDQVKNIAISKDGKYIAGGTVSGKVYLWESTNMDNEKVILNSNTPIHVVTFSPSGNHLAIGDDEGNLILITFDNKTKSIKSKMNLAQHRSRVNDIQFSQDEFFVASAGFDGRIHMYTMNDLDELPITMVDHNSYVWSLNFTEDGDYLIAGSKDGAIKLWPTNPQEFARQICDLMERNMNRQEWNRYVADDIPFQMACPDLIAN